MEMTILVITIIALGYALVLIKDIQSDTSNLKFIETKLKQHDNYFSLNLVVHPMKVF